MNRIRTRLIVASLCVALLPAVPLSLVVRSLLERSFNPATSGALEQSIAAGLEESRDRLQEEKARFASQVVSLWRTNAPSARGMDEESGPLETAALLFVPRSAPDRLLALPGDDPAWQERRRGLQRYRDQVAPERPAAVSGEVLSGPERVDDCLAVILAAPAGGTVAIARLLPEGMVPRAQRMTAGLGLLRVLQNDRGRVLRSYVVPFLLIYALLILLAIAIGAVLARRLARPLEALAASTQRVAAGDLQARVEVSAPGEVGRLVMAFNGMVARLAEQRRELARLERIAAWRDLARTLAHEIKNPLTPILLAVQAARESYRGGDQDHVRMLADCEEIVQEEVEGLRGLVREFSEFARLPQPHPQPGDLGELLGELVRLYGDQRVSLAIGGPSLEAWFDAAELRRALINLIDNGLAASATAGRSEHVGLDAGPEGAEIVVNVRDEGCGIKPQDLGRIFEPDFSTKKEGMGLGLCIVEQIVRGHGGTIAVESQPGRGTCFTIRLPRRKPSKGT